MEDGRHVLNLHLKSVWEGGELWLVHQGANHAGSKGGLGQGGELLVVLLSGYPVKSLMGPQDENCCRGSDRPVSATLQLRVPLTLWSTCWKKGGCVETSGNTVDG